MSDTITVQDFSEPATNPDPAQYKILDFEYINRFLILTLQYTDAKPKNFEGKKILVYKDIKIDKLLKQKLIDPHFSDNKYFISPHARFSPTREGAQMSKSFCKNYKWN